MIKERHLKTHELKDAVQKVLGEQGHMLMAYAWQNNDGLEVIYLSGHKSDIFEVWRCQLAFNESLPSLAQYAPMLGWYEREMSDLFGIKLIDHPEPYPLILHEGAKLSADHLLTFTPKPWNRPEIKDTNLQDLPFGPIRSDVTESAAFNYSYAGEMIVHFEQKLFFKHRGMERRFCGVDLEMGVVLSERVSGVGSFSHALAFCQAVESAARCTIPKRAAYDRVILAELERLYNHLHYFGHLCDTTTLKVAAAEGKLLEESFKQLNARVSGSRFLRGILQPGGLRRKPNFETLSTDLEVLKKDVFNYLDHVQKTRSHINRLIGTGLLSQTVAFAQGATGPIARASNIHHDLRCDHPYAAYDRVAPLIRLESDGDAYARALVRAHEIRASFDVIERALDLEQALDQLPDEEIVVPCEPKPLSEGLGWAESPRGSLFYAVHFDKVGKLARTKIKSPSFSNWRVFPFTVHGTAMMDYAINEASFGLSIAGCDR